MNFQYIKKLQMKLMKVMKLMNVIYQSKYTLTNLRKFVYSSNSIQSIFISFDK